MTDIKFHISSSPHFSLGNSTQKIMACVLVALLPEVIAGTVFFGFRALAVVLFRAENRCGKSFGGGKWGYACAGFAFYSSVLDGSCW